MLTFLSDILYVISHSLLVPDIIVLLLLIAYAIFSIGSILVEFFTERHHFKVVMPQFLDELTAASEDAIPTVIDQSGLLRRQKTALLTVFEHRSLPGDALIALVHRLLNQEESRYDHIVSRNNMAAKVAPMFGLVGTLVPLGPGIQALGKGDTAALSSSLLVAFDTTVAGLVAAAVCLIIAKIRQNWYDDYMSALDSSFATMVQKIEDTRALHGAQSGVPSAQGVSGTQGTQNAQDAQDAQGAQGAQELANMTPSMQSAHNEQARAASAQSSVVSDTPLNAQGAQSAVPGAPEAAPSAYDVPDAQDGALGAAQAPGTREVQDISNAPISQEAPLLQSVTEVPHYALDESFAGAAAFEQPLSDATMSSLFTPQPAYGAYGAYGAYVPTPENAPFPSMAAGYDPYYANPMTAYGQPAAAPYYAAQPVPQLFVQPTDPIMGQQNGQPFPAEQAYTSSGMPLNPDYDAFFGNTDYTQGNPSSAAPGYYPAGQ